MGSEIIAERFRLEGLASADGGAAQVYRAHDLLTEGPVALKLVPAENGPQRRRLELEAGLLSSLGHPNIVELVGSGETERGDAYLAMEWLDGVDLERRLKRGRLAVPEALIIAREIASALAPLHALGVVHRDIKPANIFLPGRRARTPKLIDFGLAARDGSQLKGPATVAGTAGYLAPEQARGTGTITAAADVFSLGLVLYECLTGLPAYTGTNRMALLAAADLSSPPSLLDERPDLQVIDVVLTRMLAPDPSARVQDAAAAADALTSLCRSLGLPASGETRGQVVELRDAAAAALDDEDLDAAEALAGEALEAGARGAPLVDLHLVLAEVHHWRGAHVACAAAGREAQAHAPERTDRWYGALTWQLVSAGVASDREAINALVGRVVRVVPEPQERIPRLIALSRSCEATLSIGDYELSAIIEGELEEVTDGLRALPPYVAGWLHGARASLAQHRGDTVEFMEETRDAVTAFASAANPREEATRRLALARALLELGAHEQAADALEIAKAAADELGLAHLGATACQQLGVTHLLSDRVDSALELLGHAEMRFAALGDRRLLGATQVHIAEGLRRRGEVEGARAMAERAARALRASPPTQAWALSTLASILVGGGQIEAARAAVERAFAILEHLGQMESREEHLLLTRARVLDAAGEGEAARHAIRAAMRELSERAGRISDPGFRARFLRGTRERLETRRLYDAWTGEPPRQR